MCGVVRLARFNLQAMRPRVLMEGTPKIDKKHFVGLPIPPAAGLIAAIIHLTPTPLSAYSDNYSKFYGTLLIILVPILGILMVSTLRYTSFKNVGTGKRNLYLILILGAFGMLVWLYSHFVLLAIAAAYVSHGILWYVFGMFRVRKKVSVKTSN